MASKKMDSTHSKEHTPKKPACTKNRNICKIMKISRNREISKAQGESLNHENKTSWNEKCNRKLHGVVDKLFPLDSKTDRAETNNFLKKKKRKDILRGIRYLYPAVAILGSIVILSFGEAWKTGHSPLSIETILDVIMEVGRAIFVAGTIGALIEIFHYRHYFVQRLEEVIFGDYYLDQMDQGRLEDLLNSIEERLWDGDQRTDKNGFYQKVRKEISDLALQPYFELYELTVTARVIEIGKVSAIKKSVRRDIIIVNPSKETAKDTLMLGSYMKSLPTELEQMESYKILTTEVDGRNISFHKPTKRITKDGDYPVGIEANYDIYIPAGEKIRFTAKTESIVPIDDCHYWHRINKPCKVYRVTCNLVDSPGWTVDGTGFGFQQGTGLRYKHETRHKEGNTVFVFFNEWILPGDGATIGITREGTCAY